MTAAKKKRRRKDAVIPPPPPPKHEWEQQQGETDLAFASWVIYRDLPPGDRSHAKVATARDVKFPERRSVSVREIDRLSLTWRWPARVRLWDAMIAERAREGEIAAAVKSRTTHLALAQRLQRLGGARLDALIAAVERGEGVVNPRDAIRAVGEGVKLERLVRGESTENQAQIATTFAEMAQEAQRVLAGETVNTNPSEYDDL